MKHGDTLRAASGEDALNLTKLVRKREREGAHKDLANEAKRVKLSTLDPPSSSNASSENSKIEDNTQHTTPS